MWNHAQYLFWALMAVLKHLITNKCTLAGQWSVVTLEFSTVSVSVIQKFDSVGQASLTPRPGSSMPRNNLAHTRYKIQDTRPLFASTSSRCCWSTRQNCQNWEQRGHEHTLIIEVNWVWHQFCSCSSLEEDPIWSKSGSQLGRAVKFTVGLIHAGVGRQCPSRGTIILTNSTQANAGSSIFRKMSSGDVSTKVTAVCLGLMTSSSTTYPYKCT